MVNFTSKPFDKTKDYIGFNLGNISNDFDAKEEVKTGLHGSGYEFSVDHKPVDRDNVRGIHAYLMRKHGVDNNFPGSVKKLIV